MSNKVIKTIAVITTAVLGMILTLHWKRVEVLDTPAPAPTATLFGTQTGPTYFAEVDGNGDVLRVIVATQAFIDTGRVGDPTSWIETDPEERVRKNYAGKGYKYDAQRDAFIAPKPDDPEATLDSVTLKWKVPKRPTLTP